MKILCLTLFFFGVTSTFSQNSEAISSPDVMPQFPGGSEEMMKFIQMHLKLPPQQSTDSTAVNCKCIVEFTIDKTGYLKNAYVVRSCIGCVECDAEAIRVIEKMPKWKPGLKNNSPVAVKMGLPIFFTGK